MKRLSQALLFVVLTIVLMVPNVYAKRVEQFGVSFGTPKVHTFGPEYPSDSRACEFKFEFATAIEESNYFIERNQYIILLYDEHNRGDYKQEFVPGIGIGFKIGYINQTGLKPFVGAGVLTLLNGGNIEFLAQSVIYGAIDVGVRYNNLFDIGISHISSPFHTAKDKDVGINSLYIKIKF